MSVSNSTPGQIQVIKRTGDVASFDAEKISVAIGKAFLAVEGQQSADSSRIHDRISQTYRDGIKYVQSPPTFLAVQFTSKKSKTKLNLR